MTKFLPADRTKAIAWLVLSLLFCWSAWERFRLPLTPYTNGDVWAYVMPGLSKLTGGGFKHWFGQCFIYPGFLYVVLLAGGDFRWITVIQYLFGLGTGALLFACWMQCRRLLPISRLPVIVFQSFGVLMAGVYLLSTATVAFERVLRPEAIFPFFAVLNIYCNLRFIRERFSDGQPRRALYSGGAAIFVSVLASLLKPSFSLMLVLSNLPVIVSLFRPGQSVRDKLLLVSVPALVAALLLVWPEWALRQEDRLGKLFLAESLFSVHADLINEQIAEDLAQHADTPYPTDFLAAVHEELSAALLRSQDKRTNYFPVLGFNADHLIQGKKSFLRWVQTKLDPSGQPDASDKTIAFCRYYYWRAFRRHPERMRAKIGRQIAVFYRFGGCPAYAAEPLHDLDADYQRSFLEMGNSKKLMSYPAGAVLIGRTKMLENSGWRSGNYPLASYPARWLAVGYLATCLGAVALSVCAWAVRPVRRAFGVTALVLPWLYSYNFGTVLMIAIGHSLDMARYSQYQLAYTLLPEVGALWLAVEGLIVAAAMLTKSLQRKPGPCSDLPSPSGVGHEGACPSNARRETVQPS